MLKSFILNSKSKLEKKKRKKRKEKGKSIRTCIHLAGLIKLMSYY